MSTRPSTVDGQPGTRTRLVESAASLFSRRGYSATGVKAVLAEASAPYGSLYHWFPGGKQELGVAAIEYGGARYRELIESVYPPSKDVAEATAASFTLAAEILESSDYDYACPIATIALEVASSDEPMRVAAAAAFESWLEFLQSRLTAAGISEGRARDVAVEIFSLLEGSLLLARTTRMTQPLLTAGRLATSCVEQALADEGVAASKAAAEPARRTAKATAKTPAKSPAKTAVKKTAKKTAPKPAKTA